MQLSAAPAAGTKVGEVKLTWYVRMSTRRLSWINYLINSIKIKKKGFWVKLK